jgi:hypothetical protein
MWWGRWDEYHVEEKPESFAMICITMMSQEFVAEMKKWINKYKRTMMSEAWFSTIATHDKSPLKAHQPAEFEWVLYKMEPHDMWNVNLGTVSYEFIKEHGNHKFYHPMKFPSLAQDYRDRFAIEGTGH